MSEMWLILAWVWFILTIITHLVGIASAAHAVLYARNSSAAIAWGISLVTMPWMTLPLYWVFGRHRFVGYVQALRAGLLRRSDPVVDRFLRPLEGFRSRCQVREKAQLGYERLARIPMTAQNRAELLIDGQETYESIFEGIEKAQRYVLVFFFILRADKIGKKLQRLLIEKANQGVPVYLMYDAMGSLFLKKSYIRELRAAGVEVVSFRSAPTREYYFQLNFRNHRKIVVTDGRAAWVGGLNLGDEHLGTNKFYGPWRDTHLKLEGPAVQGVQLVFQEDYYWASGRLLDLDWEPQPAAGGDTDALYMGSGPADELDVGLLYFVHTINCARKRVWIASPYFVPDASVIDALKLAAMRGVDVRVIVPLRWDLYFMYLAAFSYLPECEANGIKFYRFKPGFMHQKVMLVDDDIACVGSSNVDNRSMRLNFEGNAVMISRAFAQRVEAMLRHDFARSVKVEGNEYERMRWPARLGVKLIRLLAPIL
ncbi:MAG: cardiolipin synthase [Candidatus Xenobia bacterium]